MAKGHVHNWVLVRTQVRGKHTYEFYECINPGCPNPYDMRIR